MYSTPLVHECERMLAIARAGENPQAREIFAHHLRRAHRCVDVVDRKHEEIGRFGSGRAQQIQPRCIAVIDLVAEAAHEVDVRLTRIERGEFDVPGTQYARDDLPDAAEACDDDAIVLLVDSVEGAPHQRPRATFAPGRAAPG